MLNTVVKKVTSVALLGALSAATLLSINVSQVVASGAKLEITDSVDKAIADRGETLSYTINVKNSGDTDLTNVIVWVNEPNLANYVPGSSSAQGVPNGQTVALDDNWINTNVNLGKVPAGKSVVVKYQTKVAQNANPDDIIWSVAAADSDQTGKVQAQAFTKMVFRATVLCGAKTADKTSVSVGDTVTFTIKVCNQSNINLNDVIIEDKMDPIFAYVAGSTTLEIDGKTLKIDDNWIKTHVNIGNLPPKYEAFLKYQVTIKDGLKDGQIIKNIAYISSKESSGAIACEVVLKGKVLGVKTPPEQPKQPETPTQLPNTGPGEVLLLVSGLVPAGLALKKFKARIK